MRMGAFLLGGLVGAAAVIYFQNNRNSMMLSTMSSTTDALGKMVEKGMNMTGMGNKQNAQNAQNSQKAQNVQNTQNTQNTQNAKSNNQSYNRKSFDGQADLGKVENMVKQDPSVKQKVDEILSENNQKSAVTSH